MSALQEIIHATTLFVLALVIIPVGVFAADIIKNYIKKGEKS